MRVNNLNCALMIVSGINALVGDSLPVFHASDSASFVLNTEKVTGQHSSKGQDSR